MDLLNGVSWRALFFGSILAVLVTAYSAYAGLQVGGVYWPIVTTSLVSLFFLSAWARLSGNKTSVNEINLMQTVASSGGLLAAGIIFTIPAAFLLGYQLSVWQISLIALVGGLLGVLFSFVLRREMLEVEKLPCPDGQAAADLIKAGDEGGEKIKWLGGSFAVGALLALARDKFAWVPVLFDLRSVNEGVAKFFPLSFLISLIPVAGGFLIGPLFTGAWFLGALATYFVLTPLIPSFGWGIASEAVVPAFSQPLGAGIILGAAIAYFLYKGLPTLKRVTSAWKESGSKKWLGASVIVAVGLLTLVLDLNPALSVLAVAGAFLMSFVAARVTGEMNVDPLEVFALIIMLSAKLFLGVSALPLIVLSAVVAIAAGIAGDMMLDLKTGLVLGTKPEQQLIAQIVGAVVSALVIGVIIVALNQAHGFGSAPLFAPQAVTLKNIVSNANANVLLAGIVFGAIAFVLLEQLALGLTVIAFGIGLYVPLLLSFPLFVGGLVRWWVERNSANAKAREAVLVKARVLAAGFISGESLIAVALALLGLWFGVLL